MPLIRKPGGRASASAPVTALPASDVLTALTAGTEDERWRAARAAADIAGGVDALGRAVLVEPSARVREAMLTSLARIGSPQGAAALAHLLRVDDAGLRTGALDALRAIGADVREHLPTLLTDPDSDVRLLSCEVARALPSPEATQLLCELLERESELNVCAAAVEVLAEVATPDALPILARCQARFANEPFLTFAVKTASDRILSQPARPRG